MEASDPEAMEVDKTEKMLPDFVEMVRCISEKASTRLKSQKAITYGSRTLPFDAVAYAEVQLPRSYFFVIEFPSNMTKCYCSL